MREEIQYDATKFAELMLFVAELSAMDPQYGRVKLAKQLFHCDFRAYMEFGRPITGAVYMKKPMGPVPRPLWSTIEQLVKEGRAGERKTRLRNVNNERIAFTALDLARLEVFRPEEVDLAHTIVNELRPFHGGEVSDQSHEFLGWKLARPGEEIPYYTAYLDNAPTVVTPRDVEIAQRLAAAG